MKTAYAHQVLFVDSTVQNYEYLLQGLESDIHIFVLQEDTPGISQISAALSHLLKAGKLVGSPIIYLIAHGSPGCLHLGNAALSLDNLEQEARQLSTWSAQAIVIYGCWVASGDAGEEFVQKLHRITGADIAASASLTNHLREATGLTSAT